MFHFKHFWVIFIVFLSFVLLQSKMCHPCKKFLLNLIKNIILLLKYRVALRLYHMTDSIWATRVSCKMTDQTLLRWPTKVKYVNTNLPNLKMLLNLLLNSAVSLYRSPSPGSLCIHWLGYLPNLASPAHFARSHDFIECYTEV